MLRYRCGGFMEDNNLIHQFVCRMKSKFAKNSKKDPSIAEYAFSSEEMKELSKQNKQKILDLKQDSYLNKNLKQEKTKSSVLDTLDKENGKKKIDTVENTSSFNEENEENLQQQSTSDTKNGKKQFLKEEEKLEDLVKEIEEKPINSFIHIDSDHQKMIMENWNQIEIKEIDKDIMDAKEIINHNYTITYADEAEKFIHDVRKKYEIVICYLIGFNNEKKGIFDKTIFSSKMDDEWKFLNQYIKILEKIRNFKK